MILNSETNHDGGGGGSLPTTAKVTFVNNASFEMWVYVTEVDNQEVFSNRYNLFGNTEQEGNVVVPSYISFFSAEGIYGFSITTTPTSAAEQEGYTDNLDASSWLITGECTMTIS